MFDVLVAGEINPDLILTGDVEPIFGQVEKLVDAATLAIGSSSVIFACGAARLGLSVGFVGLVGNDLFGDYMLAAMRGYGIDIQAVQRRDGQTGLTLILNKPTAADRAILTYPGLMTALRVEDIPQDLLASSRHLHVASYFLQTGLQPGLVNLFNQAHAAGLSTSLDTNFDPTEEWRGFGELLQACDVFLPNEREAFSLTGVQDVNTAARKLAGQVRRVAVVKRGALGALAVGGNQLITAETLPVSVIDTVGAGDSFDAGFIYGFLNQWPLERSLRLACVCGALSTQAAGGTASQPSLVEALPYVSG